MKEHRPFGICIKNTAQFVESQDELCKKICGDQTGKKCEKGCMEAFSQIDKEDSLRFGFHHFKNIEVDGQKIDAVVFFDGEELTTHMVPRKILSEKSLQTMLQQGLSAAELNVVRLMLDGLSNNEIAEKLFISRSTLKTHINNIYKKVPESLRPLRR